MCEPRFIRASEPAERARLRLGQQPAAVDHEIDAVHATVREQEVDRVDHVTRRRQSAARRSLLDVLDRVELVAPGRAVGNDAGMDRVEAHGRELHGQRADQAADRAVHGRDRGGPGVRPLACEAAEQHGRRARTHARIQRVRDLGVADQLHRHDAPRARDVVLASAVVIALDSDEREIVDVLEAFERLLDPLRLGYVEGDAARVAADFFGDARRTFSVAPRNHDLRAAIGVELRDRKADAARAADHEDAGFVGSGHRAAPCCCCCSATYSQSRAQRYELRAGGCGDWVSSQRTLPLLRL